ncbi:transglutaminase-like domain-containing protein [Butyrivibrio sp. AE3009]|uniref:transglutaminase-like domain-containing protein n=1 Tax=Butyrivibrio sp. AE3009 TaxID=1280666 RepID=UPI0003B6A7EC|nr:transglutaminase domain-containing protein [Butyrivibrio sp. AE3009]
MKKNLTGNRLNKIRANILLGVITCLLFTMNSCGDAEDLISAAQPSADQTSAAVSHEKGSRDNAPVCLVPTTPGKVTYENDFAHVDASNISEGYVVVRYTGSSPKVKLQITGPDEITYTYSLNVDTPTDEVFPLQSGDGEYMVNVYENIQSNQYSMVFTQPIEVILDNEFGPFLYPNQYVSFEVSDNAIQKGADLCYSCNSDLDVVSAIYNFVITNIEYDYDLAESVQSGYLPDIDEVLATRKGICLDYAALMTSMLRSQRIPTRMEVGYAGTAYHAWLSTYIEDIGWVNGMIEFDGTTWSLMDPTFASTTDTEKLRSFIGDGKNYSVKYIY